MQNIKQIFNALLITLFMLPGFSALTANSAYAPTQQLGLATAITATGSFAYALDKYCIQCGRTKQAPTKYGFFTYIKNCVSSYLNGQTRSMMSDAETNIALASLASSFFGITTLGCFGYNKYIVEPKKVAAELEAKTAALKKLEMQLAEKETEFKTAEKKLLEEAETACKKLFIQTKLQLLKTATPEQVKNRTEKLEKKAQKSDLLDKNNKTHMMHAYKTWQAFVAQKKQTNKPQGTEQPSVKGTPDSTTPANENPDAPHQTQQPAVDETPKTDEQLPKAANETKEEAKPTSSFRQQAGNFAQAAETKTREFVSATTNATNKALETVCASDMQEQENFTQFYEDLGSAISSRATSLGNTTKENVKRLGSYISSKCKAAVTSITPDFDGIDMSKEELDALDEHYKQEEEKRAEQQHLDTLAEQRKTEEQRESNARSQIADDAEKAYLELQLKIACAQIDLRKKLEAEANSAPAAIVEIKEEESDKKKQSDDMQVPDDQVEQEATDTTGLLSSLGSTLASAAQSTKSFIPWPATSPWGWAKRKYDARQERLAKEKSEKEKKAAEELRLYDELEDARKAKEKKNKKQRLKKKSSNNLLILEKRQETKIRTLMF